MDNKKIESVVSIVYLGQLVILKDKTKREVDRRIVLTWKKYWSLKYIFKGPYTNRMKGEILNVCVILSHGPDSVR